MTPVKLKLTDFLSYRSPSEIDFTAFDVACITGPNGAGKSTLLDAVSWALFGAARGSEGGQNTDRLVRDGADKTSVEFTFELGDETYRIARTKTRGGRGDVRLMVRAGEVWTNLAAESVRETEARVAELLRLDYATFTASAFLLQGRADDFLRLPPDKRKDVLVRLLDLGVYDRLEEASRSYGREALNRQKLLAQRIDELGGARTDLDTATADLERATIDAAAAAEVCAQAEKALETRRQESAKLDAAAAALQREGQAIETLIKRIADGQGSLERKDAELRELEQLLARAGEITAALGDLERLEAEDEALQHAAQQRAALETARAEAAGKIDAERRALAAQREALQKQADGFDREADALDKESKAVEQAQALLAELATADTTLADVRTQLQSLHAEGAGMGERIKGIEGRRAEVDERLELINQGGATCPLCEAELGPQHKRTIIKRLKDEDAALQRDHRQCEARRAEVRKEWKRLREEEERLQKAVAKRESTGRLLAELQARVALVPERRRAAADVRAQALALRDSDAAAEHRLALAELDRQLGAIVYDAKHHDDVKREATVLKPARDSAVRIADAARRRPSVVGERDEIGARMREDAEDLDHRRELLASLDETQTRADEARAAVERARVATDQARTKNADASALVARLHERTEQLMRAVEELDRTRAAEQEASTEGRRYGRLSQAFGRGGIPDLILENALPELEHEANDILGRLTDYEMSVHFQMQRNTRTGKQRETFDVKVQYDGGDRDFQMFSGGEAFRIAFAIRLGLSKMLVRRAGARLETLVVDEGFGTQDAEGRERLVEVINLARQEFRKVLVISHIDELKDAFPTQIRIMRDPSLGSLVTVEGR